MMWTDHTHQAEKVKFRNVPFAYEIEDIRHVDHVGMFWTFDNNETWLTLNNKRLFLVGERGEKPTTNKVYCLQRSGL